MNSKHSGERRRRLLIALDADGTVVQRDGRTISPRVRAAVRAVRSAGHRVVLATGRSPLDSVPVSAALDLAGEFSVCSNGAVTLLMDAAEASRYTLVTDVTFDPRRLLVTLNRKWPACAAAVELPGARGFLATAAFPRTELPGDVPVVSWPQLALLGATRLLIYAPGSLAEIAEIVAALGFACIGDTTGAGGGMEVSAHGVTKAAALERIRIALGNTPADTVAIGDHLNDAEMLSWANRGIAMGNAPAIVREAANEVTNSCDDDGVAVVLESIIAG